MANEVYMSVVATKVKIKNIALDFRVVYLLNKDSS